MGKRKHSRKNSRRTAEEQQKNTNKNDKNEKNDKNKDIYNYKTATTTNIINIYNQNIHPITPFEIEKIEDWLKDVEEAVVVEAIKEAVTHNVRRMAYIEAILRNWTKEGITTMDALNAKRRDQADQKKQLEQVNGALKNRELSEEEKDELEKMNEELTGLLKKGGIEIGTE